MKQGRFIRLRQERELRGWSRSYIAEQVEVDLGTVGRWERGERLPQPHYRQKLCGLFGKSAQELGLLPEDVDETDEDAVELDLPPQNSLTHEQGTTPLAREASTSKALSPMNRQNRQRMLDKMYSFWVKGVLEQSLYGSGLVALSLTEQRDAVADPWALTFQQFEVEAGLLTADMHIGQIYDEVNGELLILGEPGSGKTTLLLELTRILLERANREESHPIPVVFNLTSWAIRRHSFGDWLVEELCVKYQVPRKLAQTWVQAEQILPLLDGLDEVAATARGACVETINAYRREHGLLPMVVCCRLTDYFAQDMRLLLRCGVVVQPLTAQQIEAYLSSGGERFAILCHALQEDPALQELASSPLMLSILAQTYQNKAIEKIPTREIPTSPLRPDGETSFVGVFSSLEVRRREVFATYIRRMLTYRKSSSRYTAKQTRHWLTWLARQLVQQQQTEFYIERMQPDWLPSPQSFRWYSCLLVGLLMGVLGGITAMLADVPVYELVHMQIFVLFSHSSMTAAQCADPALVFGTLAATVASIFSPLIVGLLYGGVFGLFGALLSWNGSRFQFAGARTRFSNFYRYGLAFLLGLGCGSIFVVINLFWVPCPLPHGVLYDQLAEELSYGSAGVLVGGLLGLLTGDLFGARKAQIQPVEALVWTRVPARRRVIALLLGGAFGVLVGGGVELASEIYLKSSSWQTYLPGSLLIGGLLGLAVGGGIGSFSRHMMEESSLVKPNEGIRRSLRNGLIIGVPIGLALGGFIPLGLALWLIPGELPEGLLWCIPLGLMVSLILFLLNGGYACLQHVILRFILYRQGVIPWNYARFLDEAADRFLLRKVGGGYIFIHRLLLDYFASML